MFSLMLKFDHFKYLKYKFRLSPVNQKLTYKISMEIFKNSFLPFINIKLRIVQKIA